MAWHMRKVPLRLISSVASHAEGLVIVGARAAACLA
jgi:hypothetical protein